MEWVLHRSYYPKGTHGVLQVHGRFVCFCIELPWKDAGKQLSCIPEGRYEVLPRLSQQYGHHLCLSDVPGRKQVLLHADKDGLHELQGSIVPVLELTGIAQGLHAKPALERLLLLYCEAAEEQEAVYLTITYNTHEYLRTLSATHAAVFPDAAYGRD